MRVDKAPSAPWVPSLWVKIFKPQRVCVWACCCVQHLGWVPPGLTCFLQCILLGLLWAPQFFQWVPLAVLWAPRLCLTICSVLHMGSNWAPVFLQLLVVGSRMGSCVFSNYSSWAPAWAPSGPLCFAGHGVLAAKNTILGFEIRKFPGFLLQLWS